MRSSCDNESAGDNEAGGGAKKHKERYLRTMTIVSISIFIGNILG